LSLYSLMGKSDRVKIILLSPPLYGRKFDSIARLGKAVARGLVYQIVGQPEAESSGTNHEKGWPILDIFFCRHRHILSSVSVSVVGCFLTICVSPSPAYSLW
jgi:hypothetical protein